MNDGRGMDASDRGNGATRISRRSVLKGAAVGAGAFLLDRTGSTPAGVVGQSTTAPAYVVPSLPAGVVVRPILTVGERAPNGYRMVGYPDGLGALADGQDFVLLMNHELAGDAGAMRAHGSRGAFVSRWVIDRETLQVRAGQDHTTSPGQIHVWDPATGRYTTGTTTWQRHCSADLPAISALRDGDRGTGERIFFNGEEVAFGRAWARIVTGPHAGEAWELPRLGKMAFENVVACPFAQDRTVVALLDDGALDTSPIAANNPSEAFIYVGMKQTEGNEIEKAGLTNGKFYGVRVYRGEKVVTEESDEFGLGDSSIGYIASGRFELVELGPNGDVSMLSGLEIEQDAIAMDVFRMQRTEDGAWDPRSGESHNLYFVTTASMNRASRLWRLTFDNISRPEDGGRIEILLTNTPGRMFDNLTIDLHGRLLLQEDTGNQAWVSKIWLYGIDSGTFVEVAHHDPTLFEPGGEHFLTQDEESSGIIDAEGILGEGWFLLDVQANLGSGYDPELVAGGQLLAMYVDPRLIR
jgi:hypothetical protein